MSEEQVQPAWPGWQAAVDGAGWRQVPSFVQHWMLPDPPQA